MKHTNTHAHTYAHTHAYTQCKQYEQLMKDDTKLLYSYVLYKLYRQLLLVPIWPAHQLNQSHHHELTPLVVHSHHQNSVCKVEPSQYVAAAVHTALQRELHVQLVSRNTQQQTELPYHAIQYQHYCVMLP